MKYLPSDARRHHVLELPAEEAAVEVAAASGSGWLVSTQHGTPGVSVTVGHLAPLARSWGPARTLVRSRIRPLSGHGTSRPQTLVAIVAAAGIVQLPTAAIVVALPTIHAEFDTSIDELQWTVTAFYIPFSAFLIAAGRIADIFGRKRMLF